MTSPPFLCRVWRRAIPIVIPGVVACSFGTAPLPHDAERFVPPPIYSAWWEMTEACSGLKGSYSAVRWFRVPGESLRRQKEHEVVGYWSKTGNTIVIAREVEFAGRVVRHEMLHALVRRGGHPRAQFLEACGGVVACESICVASAGSARAVSGTIKRVEPAALEVAVSVVPAVPSMAVLDGFFSIFVTARNPLPYDVSVLLPHPRAGFGLRLHREGMLFVGGVPAWDPLIGVFRANEAKRMVLDLRLFAPPPRLYVTPGLYGVQGGFADKWSERQPLLLKP